MNRVIKFRAKTIDMGRWVHGHYFTAPLTIENFGCGHLPTPNAKRIHCIEKEGVAYEIDIKTLGQFTGCKDKNGNEIYEGDIVKMTGSSRNWEVGYSEHYSSFGLPEEDDWSFINTYDMGHESEVIGNIY